MINQFSHKNMPAKVSSILGTMTRPSIKETMTRPPTKETMTRSPTKETKTVVEENLNMIRS